MKKLLLITLLALFVSCSTGQHPDFEANVASVQKLLELQGSEADLQAQLDLVHEDVQWRPAFHGAAQLDKAGFGEYLKGWHDVMEDYEASLEHPEPILDCRLYYQHLKLNLSLCL